MKNTTDSLTVTATERRMWARASTAARCGHPGADGPCMARLRDGRCIWCERALKAAK